MADFDYIRENIHPRYSERYLEKELLRFHNQSLDITNFYVENRSATKILNYFFEDLIYNAKSKNGKYSPNEILYDDHLLAIALDFIEKHPSFYHKKNQITSLKDFFFSSSMVGKVTNFNAVIARKIYEKYVPVEHATIFDFSCGYGSRLLGALTSKYDYQYIGVDPYVTLYHRLLRFASWIQSVLDSEAEATIYNIGSEIYLPSLEDKVDLSFSSPPYFNYEVYTNEDTQSYIMYPTYKEWVEHYVIPTLENLFRYTKNGGFHIVNLENNKKISIVEDWLTIASDIGFKLQEMIPMPTMKRVGAKNENQLLVMTK